MVDHYSNKELIFKKILFLSGLFIIALLFTIFLTLIVSSFPSIKAFGLGFLSGKIWDPVFSQYGCFPFLLGTLITAGLALFLSFFFSLSISILIGEYLKKGILPFLLKGLIDLLAGIPSVIYGFWGLFFLVPIVQKIEVFLGITPYGVSILTASLVLSIMIIPYSASIGREVISLVPSEIKEAGYSLGATRYEVIRKVILPYAKGGLFAGFLLSLGRALGETMAVTMVIGNSALLPKNIFNPGNTMASVIANEITEATGKLYLSSLIEIGLVLFILTTIVNIMGSYMVGRVKC
ncbi:MAG: phosphate ABC transporter permease subunit PstC [bacterium]